MNKIQGKEQEWNGSQYGLELLTNKALQLTENPVALLTTILTQQVPIVYNLEYFTD